VDDVEVCSCFVDDCLCESFGCALAFVSAARVVVSSPCALEWFALAGVDVGDEVVSTE
jgi:hypothetical protein